MAISPYLREIRRKVGTDLLLMPSVSAVVWNEEHHLLLLRQCVGGPWTLHVALSIRESSRLKP